MAFKQTEQQVQCHECSLNSVVPVLQNKQKAICPRCGFVLSQFNQNANKYILACTLTGAIFLLTSIQFDFLSFSASGQQQTMSLTHSITTVLEYGYVSLAILQTLAIFVIPAVLMMCMLYLTIPLLFNKPIVGTERVFKLVFILIPWNMAEIFLIGTLVSLIKILSLADIAIGWSFYAYILFTINMTIAVSYLDKHQLQQRLGISNEYKTNTLRGVQNTWAFLITSCLLYIPASLLPIMNTRLFGQDDPSTIMGGVLLLWQLGSFPIAIIIFIASVFIPIAKIILLAWLNYTIQTSHNSHIQQRLKLYRITEFIGRWSMVDVFVVIVLVSLIQLGNTMSITPGPAAVAFSGMVIMTMLAAMTFDSARIFKENDKNHD